LVILFIKYKEVSNKFCVRNINFRYKSRAQSLQINSAWETLISGINLAHNRAIGTKSGKKNSKENFMNRNLQQISQRPMMIWVNYMACEIQIFDVKLLIIQFYDIEHIFKSDHWIRLKFYEGSFDILFILG